MTEERREIEDKPAEIVVEATIVNDRGMNPATEPITLYGNSRREGEPLEVELTASGERVIVVPAGQDWRPIAGAGSGLAQRLWVSPPGPQPSAGNAWT